MVEGGGDEKVIQGVPFVFLVVVHKHADDFGIVPGQQDPGNVGDVLTLFQQRHHTLYGLVGYFLRLSVDDVGNRGGAQPQFLGDIPDSDPLFFHGSVPPDLG